MKQLYSKKNLYLRILALLFLTYSYGQVPSYYNGADISTTGETLKTTLSTLVTNTQTTILSYTPGVWDALKQTDLDPANPNNVLLIYGYDDSDADTTNDRTRSKDLNGGDVGDWNREHTYAKSLGTPNLGEIGPGSDAHHLRASDVTLNSIRSNRLYIDGDGNAAAINLGFYPGDEWKGDVARMMMYMYLRYGDRCLPNNVGLGNSTYSADMRDIFLEWNAEDPVSQVEINRNVILEGIQGNRNPFIDNPAFATTIWGGPQAENRFETSTADIEAPSAPTNLVATNTTANEIVLSWSASTDNVGVLAYQIFEGTTQIASSTNTTYSLTGLTPNTSYTFTIKAVDASSNISSESNSLLVTTLEGTTSTTSVVFINEIHYDNAGADVDEAVEVAGTAGTDVTGWSIIPYNGNGGATYSPIGTFSGIIPDQSNGFGTMYVTISGLQNGAPDGLALVDNQGNVVQFLSYEGSLVATNGPAMGMTSTDIGVSQSGSDAIGFSLQLTGTGTDYNSFTWQAPSANTFGSINSGQIFSVSSVVIAAPTNLTTSNITKSSIDLSWEASTSVGVVLYEIFNGTSQIASTTETTFSLTGLTSNTTYALSVKASDVDGNLSNSSNEVIVATLEDSTTPVASEFVFINEIHYDNTGADSEEGVEIVGPAGTNLSGWSIVPYNGNGGTTYSITSLTGTIPDQMNGYGTIAVTISGLQNGSPDGIALVDNNGTVIQFLSYEGSFTATNGPAANMVSTDIGITEESSAALGTSLQLIGKGSVYTDFTWAALDNTFGDINTDQKFGDLVFVNEIHYDNAGADVGEAIEIAGWSGTDLTDWSIELYNGSGGALYGTIPLTGTIPDQMNGYGTMFFSYNGIQNGSPDGLALVDATGKVIQFLSYEGAFTATSGSASGMLSTDIGISESSSALEGSSLQLIGTGTVYDDFTWDTATNTFGAINVGQVFGDVEIAMEVISIADARASVEGTLVKITGVLTVSDQFAGSAYIQDDTAGIAIFDELVHGHGNFIIGDSITVTGTRSAFNDQIQISAVTNVENNGLPNIPIEPVTITLADMGNHPAELVKILNPAFPKPGDILFGNSNYVLTDASGNGELRIDNDVEDIVGLGQPQSCDEIVGVVGRFYETYQLLPRMTSDMACAGAYIPLGSSVTVSKDKTFDVVAWNIEWFGDETNAPTAGNLDSDAIQKESVKTVLQQLDADVYTVEEVSDDVLFAQMVSEMPGYSYVLSEAVSYPNDETGTQQKVGFIYNTNTVSVVSTKALLSSMHPYYNGGDDSFLSDYPVSDKTRFYASGRLPFMMTADVTLDGVTKQFNMVALHARANGSTDSQERYDMRKYDVEVLKDTLDAQYPNANLIILGDFNDDVDFTVADNVSTTVSTFDKYVVDPTNYTIVTSALSAGDYRSYVFRENMIDHIMVSNEVAPIYINQSVSVGYEFYNASYTSTTSDHFPVSARFLLKELTLNEITATNVTCAGEQNGTATATVSGGITPYSYLWSDGQTTATATGLIGGSYSVIVTDALGNTLTNEVAITEPMPLEYTKTEDATVYYGYAPESCTTISISTVSGGMAPYTYAWSTGETTNAIKVCPEETTTYSVTVMDANGCSIDTEILVDVVDVQCDNNGRYPKVEMCHNGRSICVSQNAVQAHLNHGDTLGACNDSENGDLSFSVYPNPFRLYVTVKLENVKANSKVKFLVYNHYGRLVYRSHNNSLCGKNKEILPLWYLQRGYYYLQIYVDDELKDTQTLIKE
ncbi:endonuclease I [Mariniflexile fucanivorans]|uniref:Endonuclease I n=1 Tax=Mariniflexile fucanivorans TaxID=264023 RepID=A0A4R1RL39_9FLAO|nr:endonuclease [Mariniflexile fucanivorans]TCL66749.1 endonuclease I [Mariniflexile fucanivorans]